MKRPSFQFYPADWRNNAKLRRCSWGARGAWIELLGLLHDSDDYGLLRWPLKQIAQALGCPVKLLNELVECGVLYGVEKGACEALVYTPRSGRKNGEPVELVAAQQGPLWFSPRMVRDEYVRTVRGENTRFSEENNPQNPSPKGGFGAGNGDSPTPRQGDGSTSSSSSSTSVPNGTSAAADARQRFPMDEHWNPDDVSLGAQLRVAGLSRDAITADTLAAFIGHYLTLPDTVENAAGWCKRLVKWAKNEREFKLGNPHAQAKTGVGGNSGGVTLSDNLNDTRWAEQLEPV